MAPYVSAVCTLLCLGASTAFVVPSPRVISSLRCTNSAARSRNVMPLSAGGSADEVFGKVKGIVASQLGVEETQVVPTASFTGDLGADSLDTVELIMALEEGFDIEIEDSVAADMATVQDAVDFIAKQ